MKEMKINKDKIVLELSKEELGVLSNALNEVCNGIDVWEFETRMGIKTENARIMLEYLTSVYKKANDVCSEQIEE